MEDWNEELDAIMQDINESRLELHRPAVGSVLQLAGGDMERIALLVELARNQTDMLRWPFDHAVPSAYIATLGFGGVRETLLCCSVVAVPLGDL